MLESVVNVSDGCNPHVIHEIALAAGGALLDVHSDADHNRSVLTLAGPDVEPATFAVVAAAVRAIDLRPHVGAHPRLGAADVVPFVPLAGSTLADAVLARDACARRIAIELEVPCFLYGPERTLPDIRRHAFKSLPPDIGPARPHPSAGASCVGARPVLVAYNLWLAAGFSLADARRVAGEIRGPAVRALGLQVGGGVQVSCNLIDPWSFGPDAAFDAVAARAEVARGELVGLVPSTVLAATAPGRWADLGLSEEQTIEARLSQAGLDGGRFAAERRGDGGR